jgi:hypothetical protein
MDNGGYPILGTSNDDTLDFLHSPTTDLMASVRHQIGKIATQTNSESERIDPNDANRFTHSRIRPRLTSPNWTLVFDKNPNRMSGEVCGLCALVVF